MTKTTLLVLFGSFLMGMPFAIANEQKGLPQEGTGSALISCLRRVSKKENITFVVEGNLLKEPSSRNALHTDDETASTEAVVTKLGYKMVRIGRMCILTKTYQNNDIPEVSIEEYTSTSEKIAGLLHLLSPGIGNSDPQKDAEVMALIRTLTPDQLATMKTDNGISISALNKTQQAGAWDVALRFYIQQPEDEAQSARNELSAILSRDAQLTRIDNEKNTSLSVLTKSFFIKSVPLVITKNVEQATVETPPMELPHIDGSTVFTLDEICAGVSAEQTPAQTVAEESVGGKPVTVVDGVVNSSTQGSFDVLLKAACVIYELKVRDFTFGPSRLVRKTTARPDVTMTNVPKAVAMVLPAPYARLLELDTLHSGDQTGALRIAKRSLEMQAAAENELKRRFSSMDLKKGLMVNEMDYQTRKVIATIVFIKHLRNIPFLFSPPPYVTNFDESMLWGGYTGTGKNRFFLFKFVTFTGLDQNAPLKPEIKTPNIKTTSGVFGIHVK